MKKETGKSVLLQKLSAGDHDRILPLRCDIRNEYFEGVDFSGTDLTLSNFRKCRFVGCVFSRTTLRGVVFRSAVFDDCSFSQVDLACADMRQVTCIKTSFEDAEMHHLDASDSLFEQSTFINVACEGANFDAVIMKDCRVERGNARGIFMRSARIENNIWKKTDLSAAHFERALWKGGCVEDCDLSFAVLRGGTVQKCSFAKNVYCGADFTAVQGLPRGLEESILSDNVVIQRPLLRRLWKMKYGRFLTFGIFFVLLWGLAEIVFDRRLETTDVILRQAAQAIESGLLGKAERLLSIAGRRKLFMYQEAWLKKNRGDYFKRRGDRKRAEMAYREAKDISAVGYSLDARVDIAYLYRDDRRYDEAMREYEALLPLVAVWEIDRNVWVRILMGDTYGEWGRYTDAIRTYESIAKVSGVRREQIVDSQIKIADLKGRMGDHEDAIRLYEDLLSQKFVDKTQRGRIFWQVGNEYRTIGDRRKARERYEMGRAWSTDWSGAAARVSIAEMDFEDKKYEEALKEYAKVLKSLTLTDDLTINARSGMGNVYDALGRYRDAILMFENIEGMPGARPEWIAAAGSRITELKKRMSEHGQ